MAPASSSRARRPSRAGARLPEIEKVVCNQAVRFLTDRSLIAGWIEQHASPALMEAGLRRAEHLGRLLAARESPENQRSTLHMMFRSIALSPSAIRFEIDAQEIAHQLVGNDIEENKATYQHSEQHNDVADTITIEVPIAIRRGGVGMRIVIDSPYAQPVPDPCLVDLVSRAHIYLDRLTGPSALNTTAIAAAPGVDRADVGRILPLAFLSPTMLEAILTGRQSASLTNRWLARIELPILWTDQDTVLQ